MRVPDLSTPGCRRYNHRMRFQCQPGCTKCCEQKGFVHLTERDIERAAEFLSMPKGKFENRFIYRTKNTRRLRTPQNGQCIFLRDDGCSIHPVKPAQCRVFPFWPELVESRKEWHKTATWCPGMGKGELVQIEMAREQAAKMRAAYPHMYK
ncbi:MAG: YkgJ family cysteine cluster protein [Candidatus Korobacteraceae bacterium]